MVTLRQLECLVRVAEAGSFTRAAELLHVTQPALSHQMRALERAVGAQLLERLPRSVRLTTAGRAMLPHARAVLAGTEQAVAAARQAGGFETGTLELATLLSVSLGVLPPVLRAWCQAHRGIRVRLFEYHHGEEMRAAMAAGQADLAVGPPPVGWEGAIRPLGTEEFVIVLPADDDTAAEGTRLRLGALADRDWVHYAPGTGLAEVVDGACANAGFRPRVAVHTEQAATVPVLAAAGLGPALVPANIVPPRFDGRLLRPDPPIRRELAAYARGPFEPLTAAFVTTLLAHARVTPAHVRAHLGLDD
ncbi:LysR family transcriptional regulator [Allostreptomyces psammosilenae]|uniref:DNA-binding transcriptional LysR family regulator n=1 Tax=Allostreptomyces psammosilenae TaxID=1892865 RepID=A0A853A8M2_9ACTN|nr:LysR family transcriptional regulator [Allostreptomyces psammosilenae]NYI06878.1 DNA-binding transcriptional LysR family regulator [Allostreptomyces psammosilenae]